MLRGGDGWKLKLCCDVISSFFYYVAMNRATYCYWTPKGEVWKASTFLLGSIPIVTIHFVMNWF